MKLLGRNRLGVLYGLDDQTDAWMRSWVSELTHANWKVARDVCRQFPKAKMKISKSYPCHTRIEKIDSLKSVKDTTNLKVEEEE